MVLVVAVVLSSASAQARTLDGTMNMAELPILSFSDAFTKAVQELNKQLTEEKGKTTILESKSTAMEARLAALE